MRIEFEAVTGSDPVTQQNTVTKHGADASAHVMVQYDEVVGHNVTNGTDTISAAVNGRNTVTEHGKAAGQQAVIGRDMAAEANTTVVENDTVAGCNAVMELSATAEQGMMAKCEKVMQHDIVTGQNTVVESGTVKGQNTPVGQNTVPVEHYKAAVAKNVQAVIEKDSNVMVVSLALRATTAIGERLNRNFSKYVPLVRPCFRKIS
ncbi:unnamed protein product [Gongylonema pulchrum]|uniref:Uncharacterized protein n=1 Tax=Gongylonema pulchrum TaxID=637853 RepID=A0A183DQN9_9BILA|nr:unnamed protein product [Gongylonema pulchrum]